MARRFGRASLGGPFVQAQVDFSITDVSEDVEKAIKDNLDRAALAAAEAFLADAQSRVESQQFPGPPLSPVTVRWKREMLKRAGRSGETASKRWRFLDQAVKGAGLSHERTGDATARASLTAPTDSLADFGDLGLGKQSRPAPLYRMLEFGYVAPNGKFVPGRKLWTTTLQAGLPEAARAFADSLDKTIARRLL